MTKKKKKKDKEFYLPENGIYRAAQESFPRFRRQQFGSQDGHKLVEINLSITWQTHIKRVLKRSFLTGEQPFIPVCIIEVFLKPLVYFFQRNSSHDESLHWNSWTFIQNGKDYLV